MAPYRPTSPSIKVIEIQLNAYESSLKEWELHHVLKIEASAGKRIE